MKRPLLLAVSLLPFAVSSAAPPKKQAPAKVKAPTKTPLEARVDALWEQSDAAFHKGDYPAAIALHRQIVKLAPDDVESYSVGAWLLWSMGQDQDISSSASKNFKADARAFIAQGLRANPKNPEMWDTAGEHYNLDRSFGDAKFAFAKAVQLSGSKAPEMLRRRLAHAAEGAGDWNLATQTWTDLVRDFPNEPVNKNNLTRVQAAQKDKA